MQILQVASFNGNIGDCANHAGFRREWERQIGSAEFENLEMRYFYQSWNQCKFDESFAQLANQYDLLIFGGGGFFELKWDYSSTGTTIDLPERILEKIRTPILFNCIGTSISKGASESAIKKFDIFLESVIEKGNFVSVRNDGSYQLLNCLYKEKYKDTIVKTPDGGFFCKPPEREQMLIVPGQINICINIAGDMPKVRFPGQKGTGRSTFITEMAAVCNCLLKEENIRLIFVPHIVSDLGIISEVMEKISDIYLRQRVSCAACYNGTLTDGLANFDLYRASDLVIGMRYHANVVPIGLGVPTILLGTYAPHIELYRDLKLSHRCVLVSQTGFSGNLLEKVKAILKDKSCVCQENEKIMDRLQGEHDLYLNKVKKWMKGL